jgi:hypothetical protein
MKTKVKANKAVARVDGAPAENEPREAIVRRMKQEAAKGYAALIARDYEVVSGAASNIKDLAIEAANRTRDIGQHLIDWMGKEQMSLPDFEQFFRDNQELFPKGFNSATAKWFMSARRNFPEPITDLKTASLVLQQTTFFAIGLMEEPRRLLPQRASQTTAYQVFMDICGKQRETLHKLLSEAPIEKWPKELLLTVVNETEEAVKVNKEARKALSLPV